MWKNPRSPQPFKFRELCRFGCLVSCTSPLTAGQRGASQWGRRRPTPWSRLCTSGRPQGTAVTGSLQTGTQAQWPAPWLGTCSCSSGLCRRRGRGPHRVPGTLLPQALSPARDTPRGLPNAGASAHARPAVTVGGRGFNDINPQP